MTSANFNLNNRISSLKTSISNKDHQRVVETAMQAADGNWEEAVKSLKNSLPDADFNNVVLAHSLAEWSQDNVPLVKILTAAPKLNNMRDVALQYNVEKLTKVLNINTLPKEIAGKTADDKKKTFATELQAKLFEIEPSAVLQRMVKDSEIALPDDTLRNSVVNFLDNQPDFNIRTTSIYTALKHPEAFTNIAEEQRADAIASLKAIQRVQALTIQPEAIPKLMAANLTSAFQITEMPESGFISVHGEALGTETARQVYTNALNNRIRNEQALMTMREAVRGTGLAIIDGQESTENRMAMMRTLSSQQNLDLPNLETLFDDADYCECQECTSVYSPASYFVELLQYLRNNNLDPKNTLPGAPKISSDIKDTPLEKLFRRRPDLGCLELTCDNTFTVLPYIDLINEVMESFVVHLEEYKNSNADPNQRQARLETFNIEDEITSELLAQPQHTNYQAYCILKSAVYPFTLPYHQPIDSTRISLDYLGTSRYELLDVYRGNDENCLHSSLSSIQSDELKRIHTETIDRAVDAEFLGMTQEEYIILTKEAFWQKRYFDITLSKTHTEAEYQHNIGVKKPVDEYYGYAAEGEMLDVNEDPMTGQKGLTFVKKEFLPRTGIQYVDLVELLRTQFVNPHYPKGKARIIAESIRFSYRFLQSLVDQTSDDPKVKFAKLIEALEEPDSVLKPFMPVLDAMVHPDLCQKQKTDRCLEVKDLRRWVYCYFEELGKTIVLESGEGRQLPIEGRIFKHQPPEPIPTPQPIPPSGPRIAIRSTRSIPQNDLLMGTLGKDGTIVDLKGNVIGNVTIDFQNGTPYTGEINWKDGGSFTDRFGDDLIQIYNKNDEIVGVLVEGGILSPQGQLTRLRWQPPQDTCNLDKVRLTHLNGDPLTEAEYDRIQRFLRLWRKLGWTIDETDKAIVGLSVRRGGGNGGVPTSPDGCEDPVGFDAFVDDDCSSGSNKGDDDCGCDDKPTDPTDDWKCPDRPNVTYEITPYLLHQLVAVRKLLDLTGLPLIKLLAMWTEISTVGEKSLYSKLFLTHNLSGIDKVFKADADGNYLTQSPPAKISAHLPVLMAALSLKADDIMEIVKYRKLTDELNLKNLSVLYRHSLLAKIIHVSTADLDEVAALFGEPLETAWKTLWFLETWGKMEDAGFSFRQLNYIIKDKDDKLRPLAPAKRTILQITKKLFDGLNNLDREHQDIPTDKPELATADLVRTKASLFFNPEVVEKIIGLLAGTTVYATKAPSNLTITIPTDQKTLAKKLKYNDRKDATPPTAGLQVTGILTEAEKAQAQALSSDPGWKKALDRIGKQPQAIFNDALLGIFHADKRDEAKAKLLGGDILPAEDSTVNTPLEKQFYFLQQFMPFLRRQLAHRFIVDTLAGSTGLATDVTNALLTDLLKIGVTKQPAIAVLEGIKARPVGNTGVWDGYLIPSADGDYVFAIVNDSETDAPPPLIIDDRSIAFSSPPQEDLASGYIWSTDPAQKLKAGKLYRLKVTGQSADRLQWKSATVARTAIPTSALLPDYTQGAEAEVFTKLTKAAAIVNGFNLSVDEITYWQTNAVDFDRFDINAPSLQHWLRLQAYTVLRHSLPKMEMSLLELFEWAAQPVEPDKQTQKLAKLSQQIADVTNWKLDNIEKLITPNHFDLNHLDAFLNEVNLVKLQRAIAVADKIAVDIDRLFDWAKPGTKFWACHEIDLDIRNAIRARFSQEDWERVIKPLNDKLREHQKLALIAYLLVQSPLKEWGAIDADSLFEFFLIDVQMDACMETSRIKQAISSAQLFIQRCFLGLEDKKDLNNNQVGVPNNVLDRDRWEKWMQRYRVWEANRKVFLYPENWIEPTLRDDKSPFYQELESELLQKDINPQTVQDALKSYLFKLDEVANLKVVGLFVEQEIDGDGNPVIANGNYIKIHIFARTRNAPYFFYYRYFDITKKDWYPWEKVQVDIPSYDVEGADGKITKNGTYLIPVVWNQRLLIFFPQFMKKTAPNQTANNQSIKTSGDSSPSTLKPLEYWEIKMAWSEYRNHKWTQKQLSTEAIYDDSFLNVSSFEFIPRLDTNPTSRVVIDIHRETDNLASAFQFTGSQISKTTPLANFSINEEFHYQTQPDSTIIHSLQAKNTDQPQLISSNDPYFKDRITSGLIKVPDAAGELNFYHPFAHELLGKLMTGNFEALFSYYLNNVTELDDAYGAADLVNTNGKKLYHELKRPYSLYNWEAAFHAPMLLVDRLLKSQQFEQALKMCHYVFNPLAEGTDDIKRVWKFAPFKDVDAENILEKLFLGLDPNQPDNTPNQQINEWRDRPFEPHVIARSRPVAYMKWVVMKYIEILIAWGDYLFRQDTIETLNQATQLYVLAGHIYGPRGQKIPKRGKTQPQTYNSLLNKWDAFGNAMVELELAFPFSNQTSLPFGDKGNGVVGLANIFGFATSLYFCIPDNPKLRGLRDTIDDRLFKLRNCQNIEGVFRKLPLFEPPIDPALLVQAAAQGLSLASVLNDLNTPVPNYRFYYLLQKALELCSELKSMGNAFLSAKEKGDSEELSKLRSKHESSIQNLVMEVRKQQLEEASKSIDALEQNRKSPEYRMQHYLGLIGEDAGKIPGVSADFNALPNQIEKPIDESGLKLIPYEKEEMDKASAASDWQVGIGVIETLGSILHLIPQFAVDAKPIGVGAGVTLGGTNLGNAAQAAAKGLQIYAGHLTYQSTSAGRKGGFLRQLQDRVQQVNIAGYEIKNIDKQITTQKIRLDIANQEITNQQKQIDNAQEIEEFLRSKYTNQELYTWMEGQMKTLYYQAYTLAYDLAKKAEKVFRFERSTTASNFIQFGYWDTAYDGLLSGERLYIGLKQLEAAYQEKRGYDYEVTKHVSLRQINPIALLQLRETGKCEFALPEVLFDMDYPGHYMRRIKSVAITVPCVVGPYTSLNANLRLLEHKFRISAIAAPNYPEKTEETDDRFSTLNVPIEAIAASSGQNDSGMFELNFKDERYLPFEGAGVISKWRLELPSFKQFDYDTISDAIVHIRYTSLEGGDKLKKPATESVMTYIKNVEELSRDEGLFAAFDLKHEFATEWHKAMNPSAGSTERVIILDKLNERLPIFTKGKDPKKILATDVYLYKPKTVKSAIKLIQSDNNESDFGSPQDIGEMSSSGIHDDNGIPMDKWQVKIQDLTTSIDKLWLVVRYKLV
jgi:Tc toxin complex TcA C-terminal TcB-binding domain/Neuraminidase-like domain/Salmonella virulence plasmid 28.1kDa A protein